MQRIEIINPSLHVFCYEMQEAIQNGYEIDPDFTPVTWGIAYNVGMIKKNDAHAIDALFNSTDVAIASTIPPHVKPLEQKRSPGRPAKAK